MGKQQLVEHLGRRLERDVLLVTESHAAYPAFAREVGISHEAINASAGERRRGALHIQNVNAYHSRMHAWLMPFRGVASRYLVTTSAGAGRWMGSVSAVRMLFSERSWAGSTISANSANLFAPSVFQHWAVLLLNRYLTSCDKCCWGRANLFPRVYSYF